MVPLDHLGYGGPSSHPEEGGFSLKRRRLDGERVERVARIKAARAERGVQRETQQLEQINELASAIVGTPPRVAGTPPRAQVASTYGSRIQDKRRIEAKRLPLGADVLPPDYQWGSFKYNGVDVALKPLGEGKFKKVFTISP